MSFAENLQYLRKKENLTQEGLAEKLEISRQSVSKWESETSYPEMEKILQICQMFGCNMDSLMNGNVSENFKTDQYHYNSHCNYRTKMIATAVTLILIGLSLVMYLSAFNISDTLSSMMFMVLVVIAVIIFIVTGMEGERFEKKVPFVEDFYTDEEKDNFHRKFTWLIAGGVGLILIGLIFMIGSEEIPLPDYINDDIFSAIFLTLITPAVAMFVYGGMQKEKYDIEVYNKQRILEKNPIYIKKVSRYSAISGSIMILATIIFLLLGWLLNMWEYSWVAFPVGGLLCGIVWLLYMMQQTEENSVK